MKIGKLAQRTGCRVVTIRYYEREGLLKRPERSEGNYRIYGEEDVERLLFILHCRKHNMGLDEIRKLLIYQDQGAGDCLWVTNLIDKHVGSVDEQIQALVSLKRSLESLRARCSGGNSPETCAIMQALGDIHVCGCGHCPADRG